MTEIENIGSRIRLIRTKKNLTLEKVASYFNMTKSALSRYEIGERTIDPEFLEAFGKKFQVNANWLLYNELPIFRDAVGFKRDVTESFLELSTLLSEPGKKDIPESLRASLDRLGEPSAENYITLLAYMHENPDLRIKVFQNFYIFLKPTADQQLEAAKNPLDSGPSRPV